MGTGTALEGEVKTYKARPIGGEAVPDLLVEATEPIPELPYSSLVNGEWRRMHEQEAKRIVDAMYASLPGGILHHVFAELARRRACELAVRIFER
jgi:hypothetical protein